MLLAQEFKYDDNLELDILHCCSKTGELDGLNFSFLFRHQLIDFCLSHLTTFFRPTRASFCTKLGFHICKVFSRLFTGCRRLPFPVSAKLLPFPFAPSDSWFGFFSPVLPVSYIMPFPPTSTSLLIDCSFFS